MKIGSSILTIARFYQNIEFTATRAPDKSTDVEELEFTTDKLQLRPSSMFLTSETLVLCRE